MPIIGSPTPVDSVINEKLQQRSIVPLSFPTDVGKYHTLILEHEYASGLGKSATQEILSNSNKTFEGAYNNILAETLEKARKAGYKGDDLNPGYALQTYAALSAGGQTVWKTLTDTQGGAAQYINSLANLKLVGAYRLPVPRELNRDYHVQYDENFNYIASLTNYSLHPGTISAAGGFAVNQLKSLTLIQPQFQRFGISFKFSPKNATETRNVTQIINRMLNGMHPETFGSLTQINSSLPNAPTLFLFPNIFLVAFMPNSGHLYKTKPAVLTHFNVDYVGGNGNPAFFMQTGGPESIVIQLAFTEMEYWLRGDFKEDVNHNPFDALNYFNKNLADPTPEQAGAAARDRDDADFFR